MVDHPVTQNIDGLHQAAGSLNVLELHGSVHRNYCVRCHRAYSMEDIRSGSGVPRCACGGVIKPDVVLYGESLPGDVIEKTVRAIDEADLLIVGGTSLAVYPAASFVQGFAGPLVIINRSPTHLDHQADLLISAPIGETLAEVMREL